MFLGEALEFTQITVHSLGCFLNLNRQDEKDGSDSIREKAANRSLSGKESIIQTLGNLKKMKVQIK